MKYAFLAIALALVLTGCPVRIGPPAAPIQIFNVHYVSNFQDRTGAYVICDNLATELTYSFEYLGVLESRTSVLVGETTDEVKGEMTTREDPPSRTEPEFVEFTYLILPGGAPLSAVSLEPNAVIVEPVPGPATRIRLTIRSLGGFERTFTSRPFPVVSHC